MEIDGRTSVYALIGSPVGHSLSPFIYNYLFDLYGINARYVAFNIEPDRLSDFFTAARTLDIKGFNITMPNKEESVKYVDRIDESAEAFRSINTVVNREGCFTGHNTDGEGFIGALEAKGFSPEGKNVIITGAGGASKTLVKTLLANRARVKVFARRPEQAAEILGSPEFAFPMDELARHCGDCDLLVNATPLGMTGHRQFDGFDFLDNLPTRSVVFDLIYDPPETELFLRAKKRGNTVLNGLPHLVYQAIKAFEIYTGITPAQSIAADIMERIGTKMNSACRDFRKPPSVSSVPPSF